MLPTPQFGTYGQGYNQPTSGFGDRTAMAGTVGGIGETLGNAAFNLFGGAKNPSKAGAPYLNQIPDAGHAQLDPFINAGTRQIPGLEGNYNKLTQDPAAFMRQLGAGYQQSPGYQFSVDQATKAANQAAAAGGMVGSPAEQQMLAETTQGLASRDYDSYMNRALGLYGTGLSGMQGLYQGGQQSAGSLAQMLGQALAAQAANANQGANTENQQKGGGIGGLLGGLGSLAGFAMGGPVGGGIGGFLGNLFK
jgi:hypothetical protein